MFASGEMFRAKDYNGKLYNVANVVGSNVLLNITMCGQQNYNWNQTNVLMTPNGHIALEQHASLMR